MKRTASADHFSFQFNHWVCS